jgi:hypothetical protein
LSTDPAAAIHFDEDPEEGKPSQGKKKISLVDYFYVKVLHLLLSDLIVVQSSSSTTGIALYYRQEEHFLAHGGTFLNDFTDVRSARSLLVNVSCANSTNVKLLRSSRSLAQYLPSSHFTDLSPLVFALVLSKKAWRSMPTTRTK